MALTINTHIFLINSISFRSQAAIVSEKSSGFTFSTEKPKLQEFDLAKFRQNRSTGFAEENF